MDTFLIILGFVCIVVGLVGSVLPALPGPPLSYIGLIVINLASDVEMSVTWLVVWALVVVAVQVLDIVIPSMGTKRFGGSKYGVWGCNIGVVVGMFFVPVGIIIGPFVGAVVGELIKTRDFGTSLKAGFGAFLGFLTGTVVKVVLVLGMAVYAVISLPWADWLR